MKQINKMTVLIFSLILISCNRDDKIIKLLSSKKKNDVILGAYKAGETGKLKFAPFLLSNAYDWRMSINFSFKGKTVYQVKMIALQKIFNVAPPIKITYKPDSLIIKFYTSVYEKIKKE